MKGVDSVLLRRLLRSELLLYRAESYAENDEEHGKDQDNNCNLGIVEPGKAHARSDADLLARISLSAKPNEKYNGGEEEYCGVFQGVMCFYLQYPFITESRSLFCASSDILAAETTFSILSSGIFRSMLLQSSACFTSATSCISK